MERKAILGCVVVVFFAFFATNVETVELSDTLLNVHVIAHTHDDVGWLKTVDQYYYGSNETIQEAGVQYILDSIVEALQKDSSRKFIYVEIAFFQRWWDEQTEATKQIVRNLVSSGQLEFINGGYCMNDEANTHYSAIIDQMTQGHLFLYNEFGVRPRIGWHIDPFGHAATQASLFAQMGFDGFFFGRIEYDDRDIRNQTQNMEFVWRGSQSLGQDTQIWSHVLYTDYCYLSGFGFEWGHEPIMDDPRLYDMNVKERSDDYAAQIKQRSLSVRTNNVLIPFGCDFQFQDPNVNFKNMDKMMKYINSHPEVYGMKLFYSTPSIYLDAVYAANLTWSVKTLDFFPYADYEHAYWTGYFTSRPALKYYVRYINNLLHAADKLFTTASPDLDFDRKTTELYLNDINSLSEAFSIAQHHDAVAGTEKQHVANDYAKRLYIGQDNAQDMMAHVFASLLGDDTASFSFCPLLNVSVCPATTSLFQGGSSLAVLAYNPLAWDVDNHYVRVPIPAKLNVKVLDDTGAEIVYQTYPNEDNSNMNTLIFQISLPPMGYKTYFIQPTATSPDSHAESEVFTLQEILNSGATDVVLDNEYLTVTISAINGRLESIGNKAINRDTSVSQDFLWWKSYQSDEDDDQNSGAYIFRPNGTTPFDFGVTNPLVKVVTGKLVQEVYQTWNDYITQVIRLYNGQGHIEIQSDVGPVDISENYGREVVTRFQSDLKTSNFFYTDSQGQEMIERELNARPDRNFTDTEPIAGNYYPMNTAAYIKDGERQLTFLTDRSKGCSSLGEGQFEAMLHRRTLKDDSRGVGEPINETDVIRTTQFVIFNSPADSARQQRSLTLRLNNPPTLAFAPVSSPQDWIGKRQTSFAPLKTALPPSVHMLNLKTQTDGRVLIRLHNIYAAGEDPQYAAPVSIDLNDLFTNLYITEITEMTLTANSPKSEMHRLQWRTQSKTVSEIDSASPAFAEERQVQGSTVVTLRPMEIKTFLARVQPIDV